MINALQGLWIFLIHVVKKDVLEKIWNKIKLQLRGIKQQCVKMGEIVQ